jgi:hypothetical protein
MGMIGAFFGWEAVWPVIALGAFIGLAMHLVLALRRRPSAASAGPADAGEPPPGLRWGKLMILLAGGGVLVGLMVVAASMGVIGGIMRGTWYAVVGAGAAYYLSFLLPRRVPGGPLTQVWGLLGAAFGVAIGTAHWIGIVAGLALGGGAFAWALRRRVEASPETVEELSEQGYLPFGIGLSIAAVILAYSGGFERVREIVADVAIGLGV